jgi:hypothetical protein
VGASQDGHPSTPGITARRLVATEAQGGISQGDAFGGVDLHGVDGFFD